MINGYLIPEACHSCPVKVTTKNWFPINIRLPRLSAWQLSFFNLKLSAASFNCRPNDICVRHPGFSFAFMPKPQACGTTKKANVLIVAGRKPRRLDVSSFSSRPIEHATDAAKGLQLKRLCGHQPWSANPSSEAALLGNEGPHLARPLSPQLTRTGHFIIPIDRRPATTICTSL